MTSKLKCPFCQTELDMDMMGEIGCPNDSCKKSMFMVGTKELWQALIKAKQDLKIARNALKDARIFADTHCIATAVKTIDKALTQIEHKDI